MKGEETAPSKYSSAASASTEGAKGRAVGDRDTLRVGELGSEVDPIQRLPPGQPMPAVDEGERSPERGPGIVGRRLDEHMLERPLAQDAPVQHAVQCDAAGEAQVPRRHAAVEEAKERERRLLDDPLERGC